jgi:4-diphosphocytidyl-2-C-methyl-D-erythritol kinase
MNQVMPTRVRSHSKINLGLAIGPPRPDGFHHLTTLYQTLALYDVVTVSASRAAATSITLTSNHPGVPTDGRNTAWRMVERCLERMHLHAEVTIHIQKDLPVQGGMGAGSANAAAALLGLERELGLALPGLDRLELAAAVGSDVPLFLLGGAVLGQGRGEMVSPLPDLPEIPCVIALPSIGVSTPQAFRDWDALLLAEAAEAGEDLTKATGSDRLEKLSLALASTYAEPGTSGIFCESSANLDAPEKKQGSCDESRGNLQNDLAENTLLALVRTGIENDFERVVFPIRPPLREIKRQLMGVASAETPGVPADGSALYAALSGSGSALFGLYRSMADAQAAQLRVQAAGVKAVVTHTLPRSAYWRTMFAG